MKLITTIVSSDDADKLMSKLVKQGFPATKLGSTGGFLRRGNATLLIGVEDEQVENVVATIRKLCRARTETTVPPPMIVPIDGYTRPLVEVRVGGAVIFVQSVEHFEKT